MSNVAIALLIFGGIVVIGVLIAAMLNIAELFDLYHTLAQVVDDLDKDMDRRCAEIGTLGNELRCMKKHFKAYTNSQSKSTANGEEPVPIAAE